MRQLTSSAVSSNTLVVVEEPEGTESTEELSSAPWAARPALQPSAAYNAAMLEAMRFAVSPLVAQQAAMLESIRSALPPFVAQQTAMLETIRSTLPPLVAQQAAMLESIRSVMPQVHAYHSALLEMMRAAVSPLMAQQAAMLETLRSVMPSILAEQAAILESVRTAFWYHANLDSAVVATIVRGTLRSVSRKDSDGHDDLELREPAESVHLEVTCTELAEAVRSLREQMAELIEQNRNKQDGPFGASMVFVCLPLLISFSVLINVVAPELLDQINGTVEAPINIIAALVMMTACIQFFIRRGK